MRSIFNHCKMLVTIICFSVIGVIGSTPGVYCQERVVEMEADLVLRAMGDYIAGIKQFEIQTENTLEVVLQSGQKIQFDTPASLVMQRPNKFRAQRKGEGIDQTLSYDGKMLTLIMKDRNMYASIPAPPTIEETIDFARETLDLVAPAGDLVFKNSYELLMEDVVSGFYVGRSIVDKVLCHHLAFRGKDVDWQIWVETGDRPLPRKFIITSKWISGAPQFCIYVKSWNLLPLITDETFNFIPPKGAEKVDFVK